MIREVSEWDLRQRFGDRLPDDYFAVRFVVSRVYGYGYSGSNNSNYIRYTRDGKERKIKQMPPARYFINDKAKTIWRVEQSVHDQLCAVLETDEPIILMGSGPIPGFKTFWEEKYGFRRIAEEQYRAVRSYSDWERVNSAAGPTASFERTIAYEIWHACVFSHYEVVHDFRFKCWKVLRREEQNARAERV